MADPALNLKVNVTGASQGAAQLNQVAAATDKTTAAAGNFNRVFVDSKNATEAAAGGLTAVSGKTEAAKNVVEGLSQASRGGAQSFFGLAKAAQGLFTVFKGGAAVIGLIALGLTAAKAALDLWIKRSEDALEKARNFTSQQERIAGALKQVEDASKTAFAQQTSEVEKLSAAYQTLNGLIDAATARVDKLNAAKTKEELTRLDQQEAETLSKASPDANLREGIKRDFARRREDVRAQADSTRIENKVSEVGIQEKAATEALAGFREQLDAAALATKRAQDAADGERSKLSLVDSSNVRSDFADQLRDAVKVAEAAAKAASENEAKLRAQLQPQIEAATQKQTGARDTRELAGIEKKTLETEQTTRDTSRRNEDIDLQRKAEQDRQKKQADAIRGNSSEIASTPGLDAQPIADASAQQAAVITQKFTESNAATQASAQSIAAATAVVSALPIIDLAPVTVAFGQYHNAVLTKFTGVERSIQGLERTIQSLKQQLQSVSNASR
jgi:hypothetical protein